MAAQLLLRFQLWVCKLGIFILRMANGMRNLFAPFQALLHRYIVFAWAAGMLACGLAGFMLGAWVWSAKASVLAEEKTLYPNLAPLTLTVVQTDSLDQAARPSAVWEVRIDRDARRTLLTVRRGEWQGRLPDHYLLLDSAAALEVKNWFDLNGLPDSPALDPEIAGQLSTHLFSGLCAVLNRPNGEGFGLAFPWSALQGHLRSDISFPAALSAWQALRAHPEKVRCTFTD